MSKIYVKVGRMEALKKQNLHKGRRMESAFACSSYDSTATFFSHGRIISLFVVYLALQDPNRLLEGPSSLEKFRSKVDVQEKLP